MNKREIHDLKTSIRFRLKQLNKLLDDVKNEEALVTFSSVLTSEEDRLKGVIETELKSKLESLRQE